MRGGYFTVFDGMIGVWFLPTFLRAARLDEADTVDYVVVMPSVEQCVERVRTRVGHGFSDETATRKMHHEFTSALVDPRHVLVPGAGGVEDVVAAISERLAAGSLRVHGWSTV